MYTDTLKQLLVCAYAIGTRTHMRYMHNQHHHSPDRICSLQLSITDSLIVIGIYMPSADQPQEVYSLHLNEVNDTFAKLSPDSPAIIVGDLNRHLGHLGGSRGSDTPNSRGLQWKELIDHHSLHVPSLSHLARGPSTPTIAVLCQPLWIMFWEIFPFLQDY